ncbi:MAG: glycosyltransferase [Candidatus Levybacteria bacterium]|nr:glycosyltransferase [Candidatus Levybacteria bacterium]
MNIALINSNATDISESSKKGTDIFSHILYQELHKSFLNGNSFTSYASKTSDLPFPIIGVTDTATVNNPTIPADKRIVFELALLGKAFSDQNNYDLFHMNIGDGDIALPFCNFVHKPILITLHNTHRFSYRTELFNLYKDCKNVFFVSISNAQRNFFPGLQYAATIYNGIELSKFEFNKIGGESMIWVGRAIPEKGMDIALKVSKMLNHDINLFALTKDDSKEWYENLKNECETIYLKASIREDEPRSNLIHEYQNSKVFVFPILWEEPFGLVITESMSCGTPVVAYANGSMPEIIEDGKTGFLVNESESKKTGDWIIKKTGFEGLCEAVERVYTLPTSEYEQMRLQCRKRVEKYFTSEKMAQEYNKVYTEIIKAEKKLQD